MSKCYSQIWKTILIAQRTVSAGVSKEDDILKVDIKNKWFSDVKQSWRFVKTAQEERRLLGKNVGKKEKEIVKNINYIPSPKKVALESASKLADANDLYPINFFIYIYIYILTFNCFNFKMVLCGCMM